MIFKGLRAKKILNCNITNLNNKKIGAVHGLLSLNEKNTYRDSKFHKDSITFHLLR